MVPVTTRALIQRINRALAKEDEMLRKSSKRAVADLGEYYIVDVSRNAVGRHGFNHGDLEPLARELGVMSDFEKLED